MEAGELSREAECSAWRKAFGRLRFTRSARISKLLDTVNEFWARETSDDLMFIFLVLIDSFVVEVCLFSCAFLEIDCLEANLRAGQLI